LFVNAYTHRTLCVVRPDGGESLHPCRDRPARFGPTVRMVEDADGVPLLVDTCCEIHGLPEPEEGKWVVVGEAECRFANEILGRLDVITPDGSAFTDKMGYVVVHQFKRFLDAGGEVYELAADAYEEVVE
jgi:hypothetical protein